MTKYDKVSKEIDAAAHAPTLFSVIEMESGEKIGYKEGRRSPKGPKKAK